MPNILIRTNPEKVAHKMEGVDTDKKYHHYWTIHPKKNVIGSKVMFTDGVNVFVEGEIVDVDGVEGIIFTPLKKVNYPQPKKAPTRGFTYIKGDKSG